MIYTTYLKKNDCVSDTKYAQKFAKIFYILIHSDFIS